MSREAWGDEDPSGGAFDAAIEAGWINPADQTKALIDVMNERDRQVNEEGWNPEHDDKHDKAEMARAAACYVLQYVASRTWFALSSTVRGVIGWLWPWGAEWFKPSGSRRDLVKAAALLLAEIEREDRAAKASGGAH